jgi:lipoprotein-anchoring transpeptidase ErfK/SrfK
MRIGDTYWDEAGVPAGTVVITVDLQAKVLSVFRGGYEIGTAAILYGGDDKPTPLGVFPITQKDADHVSNLYGAPMPYMMRLTNDGISIHGSRMERGLMTHGCVGVPTAFARKLFRAAKLGDKVIVTNGERLDLGKPITAA